jgi:DNA-binding LytR/AlgR family response regulator
MANIRFLIVEDDPIYSETIELLISKMGYDPIAVVDNGMEALRLFKAALPDIVLLDISIRGNLNGIDVAKKINEIRLTPIIFITSHREEDIFGKAKDVSPFAYINKPFDNQQLQFSIELAIMRIQQKNFKHEMLPSWQEDTVINDSFFIKSENKLIKINVQDVAWIEVDGKMLNLCTSKDNLIFRASLTEVEEKLPSSLFQRVHRAFIIQLKKIESIDLEQNIVLISNKKIPIGNTYRDVLLSRINLLG